MIDRRTYYRMLDMFDDPQFIAKQVVGSMSKEERNAAFGFDTDSIPPPEKTPLHWRKNPGYDMDGHLVCAGCGKPMATAASDKDHHIHAACATMGCELYARDYVAASEIQSAHVHRAVRFDPATKRYQCGCGEWL